MSQPRSRPDLMGATREMLDRLSPEMRDLLQALLLHKSLFVGESFVTLAARGDSAEARAFKSVFDETVAEGIAAGERLEEWDALHMNAERLGPLTTDLRINLIEAMIQLKKLSTEAFVATAMTAPTETLREAILQLADIDRRHADELRDIIGVPSVPTKLRSSEPHPSAASLGAHDGRHLRGTLGRSIEQMIERLKERGAVPARLVLSPTSLRHLRDEGRVEGNIALDLPIDVDMGWTGEVFAIQTRERVSLAEILSAESVANA